jgi:DNA transformation protein
MADQWEFANHIVELLEPFDPVEAKSMFGGLGIFHQGLMIALVADGSLYLKADTQSKSLFEDEGLTRFSYFKKD